MSFDEKIKFGFLKEDNTDKIYPFKEKKSPFIIDENDKKVPTFTLSKDDLISFNIENNIVKNIKKLN